MGILDRFKGKAKPSREERLKGLLAQQRANTSKLKKINSERALKSAVKKSARDLRDARFKPVKDVLSEFKQVSERMEENRSKRKSNEALQLSSNPFRSEPSQNAFSSPTRPDYGVKNVIYGEPKKESSKPKKRRITVSFDE